MKLQNMAVIFAIIVIPMTLILSAYIGIQIDTARLQQNYDTKLLDATHDAVVAFELNSMEDEYSTNSDSLRRDIKASINALFTSLATNIGTPAANTSYITSYIPAVVFTLYDGYYIYSPIETEYTDTDGTTKTKYEHALKPYIPYTERYDDIVVNYSLDNYIAVYGYMNGKYISRSGYLIIEDDVKENGDAIEYKGRQITDQSAKAYYKAAKNFTKWIKESGIVGIVKNNGTEILNVSKNNDPEDELSEFNAHKREIMKKSIQSNLNNAIKVYNEHTTKSTDFRMPVLTEQDWDKILTNVNVISFMQGLPVGTKLYNNYAIITSTDNKQYVDKDLLYYVANGDEYYHKINCPDLINEAKEGKVITGYRSIAFNAKKGKDGNYTYEHKKLACYKCIVSPINEKIDENLKKVLYDNKIDDSLKQVYYNTIAKERWNLKKTTELLEKEN